MVGSDSILGPETGNTFLWTDKRGYGQLGWIGVSTFSGLPGEQVEKHGKLC